MRNQKFLSTTFTNSAIAPLKTDDNGNIIIGSRADARNAELNKLRNKDGYITIAPRSFKRDKSGRILMHRINDDTSVSDILLSEAISSESKKKKKDKKKNKKKDKKKKAKQEKNIFYEDEVFHKNEMKLKQLSVMLNQQYADKKPLLSSILAAIISQKHNLAVHNGEISLYNEQYGFFEKMDKTTACCKINTFINQVQRLSTSAGDIQNAYKSILIQPELQRSLHNSENTMLVNCKNGVLDVATGKLLPHSADYEFTSYIDACYDESATGETVDNFINDLCDGDEERLRFLQEIIGYTFSSYTVVKKAMFLFGPPHTGKSVLMDVLRKMLGENNVSAVSLQQLSIPCYAARIGDSKANIYPDLPNEPIKDIAVFKSMVSSLDVVETRKLYSNPVSQACKCKFIFGTNIFVPLENLDSYNIQAYFDRLAIFPTGEAKPESERIRDLNTRLLAERDYLFTWSIDGLRRLIKNNFVFSPCEESERALSEYKSMYAPEACFFTEFLEKDENSIISTKEVQQMYENYAQENNISPKQHAMSSFIKAYHPDIKRDRVRYKGSKNPLYVYKGLKSK